MPLVKFKDIKLDLKKDNRLYCIPDSDPKNKEYRYPVCKPANFVESKREVNKCMNSNWISSSSPWVAKFEDEFGKLTNIPYSTSVSNGTAAIHVALAALDIGPGDLVLMPTFTMIATASAVRFLGATPVFVDSEYNSVNANIEQFVTKCVQLKMKKTLPKAIIIVHTYGNVFDVTKLKHRLEQVGIVVPIIEDCAECIGGRYSDGSHVGSKGICGTFSLYANKNVTAGEGGIIVSSNKRFIEVCYDLKNHAFTAGRHFWHRVLGYNYRLTGLQSAYALGQLKHWQDLIDKRIEIASWYNDLFYNDYNIILPPGQKYEYSNTYWVYGIRFEWKRYSQKEKFRQKLANKGIETRNFFIPMHLQPTMYSDYVNESYPVSQKLCYHGLYIPSYFDLRKRDVKKIAEIVLKTKKEIVK